MVEKLLFFCAIITLLISPLYPAGSNDTQDHLFLVDGKPLSFSLSRQDTPFHAYSYEGYVRETAFDFHRIIGEGWEQKLHKFTYLLIKPDALVTRSVKEIFAYLFSHEFIPLACEPVNLDRNTWRAMWKYQLYRMPISRFVLLDQVYPATPSYLILLEDQVESSSYQSASNRLKSIKGSAHLNKRTAEDLRSIIGAKIGVLSYIHTPDESLDMIRETGILLSRQQRLEVARIIQKGGLPLSYAAIETQIYNNVPYHSLDIQEAVKSIENALETHNQCADTMRIAALCEAVKNQEVFIVSAEELLSIFDRLNLKVGHWDVITFCAYFSEAN
ncbi:MAG TPA: hypothetical protein VMR37_01785 [Rhabdochlamydiaceae bacterium]|jgi:hypothetical protein|nr:hypothetical protein [Rhabdochlamydiaceae bacterium]